MYPERLSIAKLISDRYPFYIPTYQRGYAWESEEIDDYINDINFLYRLRKSMNTNKTHFLGGIVTVQQPAPGTKQGISYEIVDGQQRLSTITITISVIISALKALEAEADKDNNLKVKNLVKLDQDELQTEYLYYSQTDDATATKKTYPRLKLSRVDDVFFSSIIRGENKKHARSAPASHKKLYKAYTLLRDELVKPLIGPTESLEVRRDNLKALTSCILQSCYVIFIWTNEVEEAHQLFSILNDRGKSLSVGDLLRAYSLQVLEGHSNLQRQVEDHWDVILAPGMRLVDGFLSSYYPSLKGFRSIKGDLFKDYKKNIFNDAMTGLSVQEAVEIEKIISEFKEEQEIYNCIVKWEWPYDSAIGNWEKERLKRVISTLRHDLCIPLLLSVAKYLEEKVFLDILCLLERFVFRYIIIVGAHASPLGEIYYKYAVKARDGSFDLNAFEGELRKLCEERAPDELFKTYLEAGELDYSSTSTPQKKYIKHFLVTLEDYLDWYNKNKNQPKTGKPQPTKLSVIDLDTATIEHIYPQKASVKDAELERVVNDIGNLAILSDTDNSSYGNKPFSIKQPRYATQKLKLTQGLQQLTNWSIKE